MVIYGSFGWIVQDLNLLTSQLSTIVFLEVYFISMPLLNPILASVNLARHGMAEI